MVLRLLPNWPIIQVRILHRDWVEVFVNVENFVELYASARRSRAKIKFYECPKMNNNLFNDRYYVNCNVALNQKICIKAIQNIMRLLTNLQ